MTAPCFRAFYQDPYLNASFRRGLILDFGGMQASDHTHGSVQETKRLHPDYYVADRALVLCNCVDTVPRLEDEQGNPGQPTDGKMRIEFLVALPTIENALKHPTTKIAVQDSINSNKSIIIPVSECGPVAWFGSPRNHLVTLHYNAEKNEANLIDSRPGYVSFFYPTASMKAMLQEGLRDLKYQDQTIDVDGMKFNILSQSTQYNDTFCGYWTGQNIFDLAGIDISGNEPVNAEPTTPNQQAQKYEWSDETRIVRLLIDKSTPVIDDENVSVDTDNISSSYVHVEAQLSQTNADKITPVQKSSIDDDDEFEIMGGLSEKKYQQHAPNRARETPESEVLTVAAPAGSYHRN